MREQHTVLCGLPALVLGEPTERVYFYVHGKSASKEEARDFAQAACQCGWQVVSIDLPRHGERQSQPEPFDVWQVVPELRQVFALLQERWNTMALYATSIGAWFSMQALPSQALARALFVSPVLDLRQLIEKMMVWAEVTPAQLEREGEIETAFDETLSWRYYTDTKAHPVTCWDCPTAILFGGGDHLTDRETAERFAERFHAQLRVLEGGHHWFHTPEELAVLWAWELEQLHKT